MAVNSCVYTMHKDERNAHAQSIVTTELRLGLPSALRRLILAVVLFSATYTR